MFIPYVHTRTTERVHELAHGSQRQKHKQPQQRSKSALEPHPPHTQVKKHTLIYICTQFLTFIWAYSLSQEHLKKLR